MTKPCTICGKEEGEGVEAGADCYCYACVARFCSFSAVEREALMMAVWGEAAVTSVEPRPMPQIDEHRRARLQRALPELERDAAAQPRDVRRLLKLGEAAHLAGDAKRAIQMYEKSAAIYREEGFLLKAIAVFKVILHAVPLEVRHRVALAELYGQLGYAKHARAEALLAVTLSPLREAGWPLTLALQDLSDDERGRLRAALASAS